MLTCILTYSLRQGLANSNFRAPIVAKLAQAVCNRAEKFVLFGDEQCLVVTLHSLGMLEFPISGVFAQQMVHSILDKKPDARHLTQIAWALVTSADVGGVGSSLGELLDKITAVALERVDTFHNKDCALFPWTLWKGWVGHGKGYSARARAAILAMSVKLSVHPRDVSDIDMANMATVYFNSDELCCPELFAGMLRELPHRLADTSMMHFGDYVRFFAKCVTAPPEVWEEVERVFVRKHRNFEAQAAVSTVWSFAKAGAVATQLHGCDPKPHGPRNDSMHARAHLCTHAHAHMHVHACACAYAHVHMTVCTSKMGRTCIRTRICRPCPCTHDRAHGEAGTHVA